MRFVTPLRLVPVAAALLVLAAGSAGAAPHFGLAGFGGYQGFAMDDVNENIAALNDELSQPGDLVQIDELNGDMSWGLGLKADVTSSWRLYAEYEHLNDETGGGNQIGSFTIDASSETFLLGATYFLPSAGKARIGLGAGAGYYDFGGEFATSGTVGTTPFAGSASGGGSTIGFHGRAELDVTMSPKLAFDAALGYRSAKGELEADGVGTGVDLDWSGLMTRVGFTYRLK